MGSSPTRGSSFFLGKVTALGVLCCFTLFVCLTLLASFLVATSFKSHEICFYLTSYCLHIVIVNTLYLVYMLVRARAQIG